jgi:1,4-dihydroxy-2-naphthoate polyprenyltransferase
VRLGRQRARSLYVGLVVAAYAALLGTVTSRGGPWWALLGVLSIPMVLRPARAVLNRTDGPALNGALAGTGALLGVFSLTVSAGLLIAA